MQTSAAKLVLGFVSLLLASSAATNGSGTRTAFVFHKRGEQTDETSSATLNPVSAAVVALSISSAILSPTHTFAAEPTADVARGSELFTANCAGCHAGGMNFVNEKRTLKKDALEKFVGLDQSSVQKFFTESMRHKNMVYMRAPGGKLSDADIVDVTSFVVDQAVDDKW